MIDFDFIAGLVSIFCLIWFFFWLGIQLNFMGIITGLVIGWWIWKQPYLKKEKAKA